ncbi:MAG: hypothetical protein OEZ24_07180 [Candidatus Bathyarchaeota archaeon]|nr:hypothetical protein [Candidatus Bathyarchaeota archaeon]
MAEPVKTLLSKIGFPYSRRIAGSHGHFTKTDWRKWLENVGEEDLAAALTRLAQLYQVKVYLFWQR